MPSTLICGRCGKIMAYVYGDARALAAATGGDTGVGIRCPECADANRSGRMCKCGHPLSYHATTGRIGACVWKDWPRHGPARDEPIRCKCEMFDEADPIG